MTLQEPFGNVLIVDDNLEFQSVAADFAQLARCRTTPATTLRDERRLTRSERFDLILVDINLPDGNGFDLMRELRDRYGLQGIAVSGFGMEEDLRRSRESGFREHLVKPVDIEKLRAAIARAAAALAVS